ncbi:hypothetical protein IBX73_07820 [candidate division WOR-3 bacterium]|nr:hypothetical protein [candidate division WOR-3 bacterium]
MKDKINQDTALVRVVESRNAPAGGVAGLLLLSMVGHTDIGCCCNCNCNCCVIVT